VIDAQKGPGLGITTGFLVDVGDGSEVLGREVSCSGSWVVGWMNDVPLLPLQAARSRVEKKSKIKTCLDMVRLLELLKKVNKMERMGSDGSTINHPQTLLVEA